MRLLLDELEIRNVVPVDEFANEEEEEPAADSTSRMLSSVENTKESLKRRKLEQ